jgi:hypothetical protein
VEVEMPTTTGVDERRLAIEVISNLVNVKSRMAELVLSPAGVSSGLFLPLFKKIDPTTNKRISKYRIALELIEELDRRGGADTVVREIIRIASDWPSTRYHLAYDEMKARATVQRAREVQGRLEVLEREEARRLAEAREREAARLEKETALELRRERGLLLAMFDSLYTHSNPHQRGYLFQDLMERAFRAFEIPVVLPFTRNDGAEQIDGAYRLDGNHTIVECRWRAEPSNTRDLDGLVGQVGRSGKATYGLYLSVNGWSDHVPLTLKQNKDKSVMLMQGYDLRCIFAGDESLPEYLRALRSTLDVSSEPYLSYQGFVSGKKVFS